MPRDSLTLRCRPPTPLVVEVKSEWSVFGPLIFIKLLYVLRHTLNKNLMGIKVCRKIFLWVWKFGEVGGPDFFFQNPHIQYDFWNFIQNFKKKTSEQVGAHFEWKFQNFCCEVKKVKSEKWSNFWVFKNYGSFICYRRCLNLNCYIGKKVQKNFLMGLKIWWSWGWGFFF